MFLGQTLGGVKLAWIHLFCHHVNKDLLKSFWDGVHKPSLYAGYLGFLVLAGICQHTFTEVVAEMSCIHRYCSSVALERGEERRRKEQPVWNWLNKIKIYEPSNLGRSHFVYILWLAMLNFYSRASECV